MLPGDTRVLTDPEAVAAEACRLIGAAAEEAIRQRQVFRLVLAGGQTPRRTYELLAATAQTWTAWEIFWGDERCLPVDHPDRNSRAAHDVWLKHVAIAKDNIHPIAAELGEEQAAAAYATRIQGKQPFDLVILGMGEDGHTASLFPGTGSELASVIAVHDAPKLPAERVSFSVTTLRNCRYQLALICGGEKAGALAAWRLGADLPIAQAVRSDACLLVDTTLGPIVERAALR